MDGTDVSHYCHIKLIIGLGYTRSNKAGLVISQTRLLSWDSVNLTKCLIAIQRCSWITNFQDYILSTMSKIKSAPF